MLVDKDLERSPRRTLVEEMFGPRKVGVSEEQGGLKVVRWD